MIEQRVEICAACHSVDIQFEKIPADEPINWDEIPATPPASLGYDVIHQCKNCGTSNFIVVHQLTLDILECFNER